MVLGGAATWPLAAHAQRPALPVIAFINARSAESAARQAAAFRQGLAETGYVEGQNVAVEYHWLDGRYDRVPSLVADVVRRRVAVIATPGTTAAALAAKAATSTIPIVFGVGEDPVRLGLVTSLARPGGNATGVNIFAAELTAKRLGLLHDLVPKAVRIAVLVNPANPTTAEPTLRDIPEAARALGLQIRVLNASTSREIDAAFATFRRERPDALFVGGDGFFTVDASKWFQLATLFQGFPHDIREPRLCRSRWAHELRSQRCGCVASSRCLHRPHPQRRQAGVPVMQASKFELVINAPDRQDARRRRAADAACSRRRGDRMSNCDFVARGSLIDFVT